jgi:hypothetical protein
MRESNVRNLKWESKVRIENQKWESKVRIKSENLKW